MDNEIRKQEIRRAMVAGSFYPRKPEELTRQLAEMFSKAKRRVFSGSIRAIIAPHAGYQYSGQIAADAYKQIEGEEFDSVVVVAPFHGFFKGVSVFSGDKYETPLGEIEIDKNLSARMADRHPTVYASTVGHTGSGGRGEHSLEVHLPFLQIVLGKFKLVAMIMGDQEESTIRATAEVLAAAIKNSNTLIVASTDLSHFHTDKQARTMDKAFKKALDAYDTNRILEVISKGKAEACGFGPVAAVIEATKRIGGEDAEIVSYDTSGTVTGDFSDVVGYMSAVVIGKKGAPKRRPAMGTPLPQRRSGYSDEERLFLLKLAKSAVESRARGEGFVIPTPPTSRLGNKRAVFVTINKQRALRGCIGLVQARSKLIEAVAEMAVAAAFEDNRFPQVTVDELPKLEYEISVLTPLSLVTDITDIHVGTDGLMIRLDMHSGLLLPQVAVDFRWNRIAFLEQTCLKAGLPKSSYQDPRTQIYKFTVEKF